MKRPRLSVLPYLPVHPHFPVIFRIARERWPGRVLGYVGNDGTSVYMQERGNPDPFLIPIADIEAEGGAS